MGTHGHIFRLRIAAAFGAASLICLLPENAGAQTQAEQPRERITFSNPFEGLRPPERESQDTRRTRRFFEHEVTADRGLGGGSLAPVVPIHAPPPAQVIPDRRTLELQDQRRNWIFAQPDGESDRSVEQMFGVKEAEFGGRDQRFQSVIGKYLENDRGLDQANGSIDFGRDRSSGMEARQPLNAGPENPLHFNLSGHSLAPVISGPLSHSGLGLNPPSASPLAGSFTDSMPDVLQRASAIGQNQPWTDASDFRRNDWSAPWQPADPPVTAGTGTGTGTGLYDPINAMRDAAAQPMNPITPSFAPATSVLPGLDAATAWTTRLEPPVAGRVAGLEDFNTRVLGASPTASSPQFLPDSRSSRSQPVLPPPPRRHF